MNLFQWLFRTKPRYVYVPPKFCPCHGKPLGERVVPSPFFDTATGKRMPSSVYLSCPTCNWGPFIRDEEVT